MNAKNKKSLKTFERERASYRTLCVIKYNARNDDPRQALDIKKQKCPKRLSSFVREPVQYVRLHSVSNYDELNIKLRVLISRACNFL